jgi:hypothetical protein
MKSPVPPEAESQKIVDEARTTAMNLLEQILSFSA